MGKGRNRACKKGSWSGVNDGSRGYDVALLLTILCQHAGQFGENEVREGSRSYKSSKGADAQTTPQQTHTMTHHDGHHDETKADQVSHNERTDGWMERGADT